MNISGRYKSDNLPSTEIKSLVSETSESKMMKVCDRLVKALHKKQPFVAAENQDNDTVTYCFSVKLKHDDSIKVKKISNRNTKQKQNNLKSDTDFIIEQTWILSKGEKEKIMGITLYVYHFQKIQLLQKNDKLVKERSDFIDELVPLANDKLYQCFSQKFK